MRLNKGSFNYIFSRYDEEKQLLWMFNENLLDNSAICA